jgi:hypothetical protein
MGVLLLGRGILKTYKNSPELYGASGKLENWYDERFNSIGTHWCSQFSKDLVLYFNLPRDLVFVSPTANKGAYEKIIFKELSQSRRVEMHISDHAPIDGMELDDKLINSKGVSTFHNDGVVDAKKLTLPCDIIYDIKGALWHEKGDNFKTLIQSYHSVLNHDGFLITDSDPEVSEFYVSFNNFLHTLNRHIRLFGSKRYRIERTTIQILKQEKSILDLEEYFYLVGKITTDKIGFSVYRKRA